MPLLRLSLVRSLGLLLLQCLVALSLDRLRLDVLAKATSLQNNARSSHVRSNQWWHTKIDIKLIHTPKIGELNQVGKAVVPCNPAHHGDPYHTTVDW